MSISSILNLTYDGDDEPNIPYSVVDFLEDGNIGMK